MMIRKHKDACEPPEERGPFLRRQRYRRETNSWLENRNFMGPDSDRH